MSSFGRSSALHASIASSRGGSSFQQGSSTADPLLLDSNDPSAGKGKASAHRQVLLISFVCFCCPGMWNAITGSIDALLPDGQSVASDATAAIYGTFAASSLIAPAINNMAGPRATLSVGTLGYLLYVLALLNYRYHTDSTGEMLVLLAAACNGFCAALLWTAQGQVSARSQCLRPQTRL